VNRLTETDGLTEVQRDILAAVREFVDAEILPVAILFKLAEMGTKTVAAHQMVVMAARHKDAGRQSDLEAGMAKYLACEYGKEVVEDALRIHGGFGYSRDSEIERLYRDAPLLLIGEGTAEIQKMIIGNRLIEKDRMS
jgi:alkylation response protein AidB-like acyl-CoA dehydrogenase